MSSILHSRIYQKRTHVQPASRLNLFGALILTLLSGGVWSADGRPNIVFIMSDDHAVRAVSAYGDSLVETPNIDRIAAGGMRFDRAYVGNAICGPSRATMLTGMHSHGNGFYSNEWSDPFDGNQQTLPRLLRGAGYQTAVVGKWHLYSDPVGFNHWEVIDNQFEQGTYYNPSFRNSAGIEETTGYVADVVTDKAIDWLNSAKATEQPFFLLYNHKSPHRDWLPGPQELAAWDEKSRVAEPASLQRDMQVLNQARREARMSIFEYMTDNDVKLSMTKNLTPAQAALWEQAFGAGNREFEAAELSASDALSWKYQRYIKSYLASIQSMDRQIGRLLKHLESHNLMENTIIVYTSDQGFFLGENGWFDKRWMDEVSSRIPLVMQWQGRIAPGQSTDALVQNIDFAPTLLAAADVEADTPMHGISLLPLLGEEPPTWDRDLYYHFYENPGFHGVARHYGVRGERYKLIHYYENSEWELFDLQEDPADQVNLYGKPGYANITRDMKRRLERLRERYRVPAQDPKAPWYHGPMIRLFEQLLRLQ